jgi:hypothetical protein
MGEASERLPPPWRFGDQVSYLRVASRTPVWFSSRPTKRFRPRVYFVCPLFDSLRQLRSKVVNQTFFHKWLNRFWEMSLSEANEY